MKNLVTYEEAENIALQAFLFISNNEQFLISFLRDSGIAISDLPQVTQRPEFLTGVLQYLISNEPLIKAFCLETNIKAEVILTAAYRYT